MDYVAHMIGGALGSAALFFPLAYYAMMRQYGIRFSNARMACAFLLTTAGIAATRPIFEGSLSPYIEFMDLLVAPLLISIGSIFAMQNKPKDLAAK